MKNIIIVLLTVIAVLSLPSARLQAQTEDGDIFINSKGDLGFKLPTVGTIAVNGGNIIYLIDGDKGRILHKVTIKEEPVFMRVNKEKNALYVLTLHYVYKINLHTADILIEHRYIEKMDIIKFKDLDKPIDPNQFIVKSGLLKPIGLTREGVALYSFNKKAYDAIIAFQKFQYDGEADRLRREQKEKYGEKMYKMAVVSGSTWEDRELEKLRYNMQRYAKITFPVTLLTIDTRQKAYYKTYTMQDNSGNQITHPEQLIGLKSASFAKPLFLTANGQLHIWDGYQSTMKVIELEAGKAKNNATTLREFTFTGQSIMQDYPQLKNARGGGFLYLTNGIYKIPFMKANRQTGVRTFYSVYFDADTEQVLAVKEVERAGVRLNYVNSSDPKYAFTKTNTTVQQPEATDYSSQQDYEKAYREWARQMNDPNRAIFYIYNDPHYSSRVATIPDVLQGTIYKDNTLIVYGSNFMASYDLITEKHNWTLNFE